MSAAYKLLYSTTGAHAGSRGNDAKALLTLNNACAEPSRDIHYSTPRSTLSKGRAAAFTGPSMCEAWPLGVW